MNKQKAPVLAKSAPSAGGSAASETWECPLCAKSHTPNAVTIAAMQEAEDMISGKIPCTWYKSAEELISALKDEIDT